MTAAGSDLERALRTFADRLFVTGGADPGDEAMRIAPERLAIYREGMLGNYRGMLRFAYTSAFALLDRELPSLREGDESLPRDTDALVTRFLQVSPSRTHSSREIADRFLVFLPREWPRLAAKRPDLLDLMALERAELKAALAPDDPGRALAPEEVEAVAAESLDALLARSVVRAPSASVLRLAHEVVALRAALQAEDAPERAPPPVATRENATVARSAPPRFSIRFGVHSADEVSVLDTAVPGEAVALERLALDWFARLPDETRAKDDSWKAGVFAGAVLAGLSTGFFRVT